ncbi:hypothetical protein C8R46DRAFT_1228352 [Mycena filopes]|nr:hypothetical protein C8R46DRAFT_1228352 [Mycena filopes]
MAEEDILTEAEAGKENSRSFDTIWVTCRSDWSAYPQSQLICIRRWRSHSRLSPPDAACQSYVYANITDTRAAHNRGSSSAHSATTPPVPPSIPILASILSFVRIFWWAGALSLDRLALSSSISSAAPSIFIQVVLFALSDVTFKRSAFVPASCRIRTRLMPSARTRWAVRQVRRKLVAGTTKRNAKAKKKEKKGKEGEVLAVSEKWTPSTVTTAKGEKPFELKFSVPHGAFGAIVGKVRSGTSSVGHGRFASGVARL